MAAKSPYVYIVSYQCSLSEQSSNFNIPTTVMGLIKYNTSAITKSMRYPVAHMSVYIDIFFHRILAIRQHTTRAIPRREQCESRTICRATISLQMHKKKMFDLENGGQCDGAQHPQCSMENINIYKRYRFVR